MSKGILSGLGGVLTTATGLLTGNQDNGEAAAAQAAADAAKAKAEADAAKAANEAALNNMNANFKADLTNSDVANVVVGGSADASTVDSVAKKKKGVGSTLSSTLGLNIG